MPCDNSANDNGVASLDGRCQAPKHEDGETQE